MTFLKTTISEETSKSHGVEMTDEWIEDFARKAAGKLVSIGDETSVDSIVGKCIAFHRDLNMIEVEPVPYHPQRENLLAFARETWRARPSLVLNPDKSINRVIGFTVLTTAEESK